MAETKFVFRVSVEMTYTAQEIKDDFDCFADMRLEDIEKQLTWLCNEQGIIEVENDGRATEDAANCINDFIEESLEVEESKDWEEVYSIDTPVSLINHFKGPCAYYQTAGGGPEGGYVLFDSDVYSVTRDWFQDWSSTKLVGKKLEYSMPDEYFGKKAEVRVF
jgi:hypothetical protein